MSKKNSPTRAFNTALAIILLLAAIFVIWPKVSTQATGWVPVSVTPVYVDDSLTPEPMRSLAASPEKTTGEEDPLAWVHGVAAEAGLAFAVPVEVTDEGNCGEGCTYVYTQDGAFVSAEWVKISPSIIGTEYGKFVVLHELGHANGIIGECGADAYAIEHGAQPFKDAHC